MNNKLIGNERNIVFYSDEERILEKYVEQNTTEKGIKLIRRYYRISGRK